MQNTTTPLVSIMMPVKDGEGFIEKTLPTVLNQTYPNLEIIILNDGSTDNTGEILEAFGKQDKRIRLLHHTKPKGVAVSSNRLLAAAKGVYCGRMDADDYMTRDKIEKQVAYLEAHPEVGVLGTAAIHMDAQDNPQGYRYQPASHEAALFQLFFMPAFYHPSCLFRTGVIREHNLSYDENVAVAEDFGFWHQMAKHSRLANLEEPLLWYRKHAGSLSQSRLQLITKEKIAISCAFAKELLALTAEEIAEFETLLGVVNELREAEPKQIRTLVACLDVIVERFVAKQKPPRPVSFFRGMGCKFLFAAFMRSKGRIPLLLALLPHPAYWLPFARQMLALSVKKARYSVKKPVSPVIAQ